MTQLLNVTLDISTSSDVATVTSGQSLSGFGAGDSVKLAGVDLFLSIVSIAGTAITLDRNSPVTSNAIQAQLIPSLVEIRLLSRDIRESNEFTANVFGQLDFFLTQLGTVDIESASGVTTVNTLPQILFNVSEASSQIAANLTLIGDAPAIAQQATDAAADALSSEQASAQNVVLSAQEADQAALEKQAVLDEGIRIDTVAASIDNIFLQIQASEASVSQSVIDAASQVNLAEAETQAISLLRDEVLSAEQRVALSEAAAQQAASDAQATAGGDFATTEQLNEVKRRATAAGIGYL